ncbi:MAG: DUF975 family protein [Clostridia bacterium]|nr:DUF975 family protein [Clostridia bacterium]
MPRAADFRKLGRDALSGNWAMAVLVTLIGALLGGLATGFSFDFSGNDMAWAYHSPSYDAFVHFFTIYAMIVFLIGGAIELGLCTFFINLQRRSEIGVGDLFSRFDIFGRALLLRLFRSVLIFLWSLLLIIPGIIASYRYALATYLMSQNTELTAREAINLSKRMMIGHKGRLFCLDLSFIGWFILGGLTFGIGLIFVYPYLLSARAAFFLDLQYHYQLEMNGASPGSASAQAATDPHYAGPADAQYTAPANARTMPGDLSGGALNETPAIIAEAPVTPAGAAEQKAGDSGATTT